MTTGWIESTGRRPAVLGLIFLLGLWLGGLPTNATSDETAIAAMRDDSHAAAATADAHGYAARAKQQADGESP